MTKPEETSYRAEELDREVGLLAGRVPSLQRTLRLERFLRLGGPIHLKRLGQKVDALSRDLRELRLLCSDLIAELENRDGAALEGVMRDRSTSLSRPVSLRYLSRRIVQRSGLLVRDTIGWLVGRVISKKEDRDRFVLSKGHTAPGLYSALAQRGYFPVEDLKTLRHLGSYLQGHPDMKHIPGVDM